MCVRLRAVKHNVREAHTVALMKLALMKLALETQMIRIPMLPYASACFRMLPHASVCFRMLPYASVCFRKLHQHTEAYGSIRMGTEAFRVILNSRLFVNSKCEQKIFYPMLGFTMGHLET